jgi:predicted dehydrogenase
MNGLTVRVYGDKGSLIWDQQFPDYVRYAPKGEAPRMLSRGCGYIHEAAGAYCRIPCGHPEGLYIGFANVYQNFITAVLALKAGGSADHIDFPRVEEGVSGVKFVHAVIDSAASDAAWVNL